MSYVERVLQPGEQVRHISSIHWIVYWPGVAVALLAVAAYWHGETRWLPTAWRYIAYGLALVAVVFLAREWYQWWITEIAVTNRRIIYKKGLIRRRSRVISVAAMASSTSANRSARSCIAFP
jgi:hypothetical protein